MTGSRDPHHEQAKIDVGTSGRALGGGPFLRWKARLDPILLAALVLEDVSIAELNEPA